MFKRLLFPAFGAPTIVTCTPLRNLSPLRPSFKWVLTSLYNSSTLSLTNKWDTQHMKSNVSLLWQEDHTHLEAVDHPRCFHLHQSLSLPPHELHTAHMQSRGKVSHWQVKYMSIIAHTHSSCTSTILHGMDQTFSQHWLAEWLYSARFVSITHGHTLLEYIIQCIRACTTPISYLYQGFAPLVIEITKVALQDETES